MADATRSGSAATLTYMYRPLYSHIAILRLFHGTLCTTHAYGKRGRARGRAQRPLLYPERIPEP